MTAPLDLLREAASLLYGEMWQTPLARAIPCDARLVRRWVKGEARIPARAWQHLAVALEAHPDRIATVLPEVREMAQQTSKGARDASHL